MSAIRHLLLGIFSPFLREMGIISPPILTKTATRKIRNGCQKISEIVDHAEVCRLRIQTSTLSGKLQIEETMKETVETAAMVEDLKSIVGPRPDQDILEMISNCERTFEKLRVFLDDLEHQEGLVPLQKNQVAELLKLVVVGRLVLAGYFTRMIILKFLQSQSLLCLGQPENKRSGESRGFGFLNLERDDDADAALFT